MTDEIDVPKVGPVNKKALIGIVVGVGGFIGYRYWMAAKTNASAVSDTATDGSSVDLTSDFADGGTEPTVIGAVSPTNSYGSDTGNTTSTDTGDTSSYGFHGTTNDQWTQYATTQLEQSDTWSYTDIVTALGLYLSEKPTTPAQQQIIAAAVATSGYPPVGSHVVINAAVPTTGTSTSTGSTTTTTTTTATPTLKAPGKPTVSHITKSSATISWSAVSGAKSYVLSTDGKEHKVSGTSLNVTGYGTAGKTYNAHVRAVDSTGKMGPWSANTSFATAKK